MRILTRYILFDLIKVFLLTLASMTAFVFLVMVGKEAVDNGLGLFPVLRMVPYMLPQSMQFAVPGTMLLAVTTVYGRMAAANEMVAVKSLGISPMAMIWPTLVLATCVSCFAVWLNDMAVSWGRDGVERVVLESVDEIVYGRLRTTGSFSRKRLKVIVKGVVGKRLIRPTIMYYASDDKEAITITAEEATLVADAAKGAMQVTFYNTKIDLGKSRSISRPRESMISLPLDLLSGTKNKSRSPSNVPLRDIAPGIQQQLEQIDETKQEMAAHTAHALTMGRMFELTGTPWSEYHQRLASAQRRIEKLNTEPQRRWASGFSCLSFVLIGVPMAIRRRHGEFWGSFFACFLPILIVYYPMLVGCLEAAKDGVLPPQAVWLGNLVLACWGLWLVRRVVRY